MAQLGTSRFFIVEVTSTGVSDILGLHTESWPSYVPLGLSILEIGFEVATSPSKTDHRCQVIDSNKLQQFDVPFQDKSAVNQTRNNLKHGT